MSVRVPQHHYLIISSRDELRLSGMSGNRPQFLAVTLRAVCTKSSTRADNVMFSLCSTLLELCRFWLIFSRIPV